MGTIKTKRLQAFEAAKQAGQIAITPATAIVFSELIKIEECEERIIDVLTEHYPFEWENIATQIYGIHNQLQKTVIKIWTDTILDFNAFAKTNFEGI